MRNDRSNSKIGQACACLILRFFLGSFLGVALLDLVPFRASAHADQSEPMFEMMRHHLGGGGLMMGYGMGWGMGIFGWVTTLLFWTILVLVIAALWKYISRK